jgi:hypothetical protein
MRRSLIAAWLYLSALSLGVGAFQVQSAAFHIAIIDGEGALNNVEGRLAREPIVQVEDQNHKRVAGAYVAFDTPSSGPGAVFPNGATHLVAVTDENGRAVAKGLANNGVPGEFDIQVHVTYQGQTVATTAIHQINVCANVARISPSLNRNLPARTPKAPLSEGVLGVAVGTNILVNGSAIPGNANLMDGSQLQTVSDPVRIFLGGNCEFLLAPHSAVTVTPNQLSLTKGVVRGEPFGNCGIASDGMKAIGSAANSQGIVRLNGKKLEVASVNGDIKVVDDQNRSQGRVPACSAAAFLLVGGGAAGAGTASNAALFGALAGGVAGLGIAIDALAQPSPTSP